jgi:hypothetical protein
MQEAKPAPLVIPEDAVFEKAPVTPADKVVKSAFSDALHLDGNSKKGEVVEYLKFDETEGKFAHELRQDVEPTLDWVKAQHLEQGSGVGKSKSGEWYHAASVPTVVVYAWLNRYGLKWADFKGDVVDKFLADSENAAFRVWQGRV